MVRGGKGLEGRKSEREKGENGQEETRERESDGVL